MTTADDGAPRGTASRSEARDPLLNRGPSRIHPVPERTGTETSRERPTPATSAERIRTVVVDDASDIGPLVAERIARVIRERRIEGVPAVLGLATGSTPIGVYRELIRIYQAGELSFANVVTFNLDEYYPMSRESIHS
ncbi:MAG: hypothetical protein ACR2OG_09250, partial [Gemmatimonadaceae bacterium]